MATLLYRTLATRQRQVTMCVWAGTTQQEVDTPLWLPWAMQLLQWAAGLPMPLQRIGQHPPPAPRCTELKELQIPTWRRQCLVALVTVAGLNLWHLLRSAYAWIWRKKPMTVCRCQRAMEPFPQRKIVGEVSFRNKVQVLLIRGMSPEEIRGQMHMDAEQERLLEELTGDQ